MQLEAPTIQRLLKQPLVQPSASFVCRLSGDLDWHFRTSQYQPLRCNKAILCRAGSFLPTPSVTLAVTTGAKRNQVVHPIVTKLAPRFHVMDLQTFHGTALLTPPTISLQDADSEFRVLFRAKFEPGLLLT